MHSLKVLALFVLTGVLISACGVTKRGADFTAPISSDNARPIETGVSSWYGPNFHGKLTANGEVYDMDGVTAAHRTLPFGTILLVENLDNGKTVQVRINDRGPYAKNRIIDLSKGAAEQIDMIGPGTARVRLYLIKGDLENSRITDLKVPTYTVQLGSYKERSQAEKTSSEIKGSRIEDIKVNRETYYRVYFGTYTDPEEAKKEMERLNRMGYAGFVKQIENN
ncbi:MAG: septal ring lytic transglycosylase RlpA family protein [Gracilimonas sp.]|uniref:septal ring lytic transglycosylase RlpA family protein n=1 Tax=Gracilimonas TaxID=649462 RepID=UPI001B074DB0|nr:septal ring lytic transglycosylase RlpA family protein [Gracilimonas sp.]MBO6585296.1 septal ring lytic transglycosylase RlpA family protein [Gracilimonas sp.]MBO6616292.1 septal ring lytic transglycosylase RlpA family protein [Gracilimonas sp.]